MHDTAQEVHSGETYSAAADWLSLERERQLAALGVDWEPDRGHVERDWDWRLTQLLAFRRQNGHVQVGPSPSNTLGRVSKPASTPYAGLCVK